MLVNDTRTLVSWRTRPGSFVALMGLYESNYVRLGWLAGRIEELEGEHRSVVPEDCDLHLTLEDRSVYTTTVNLTYRLPGIEGGAAGELQVPDMRVRVYHDAHL